MIGYTHATARQDGLTGEVARIEALCEPLGRRVLVSAALGGTTLLGPLGAHVLRGVREASEIFALRL
jgi:adenylate cyclase